MFVVSLSGCTQGTDDGLGYHGKGGGTDRATVTECAEFTGIELILTAKGSLGNLDITVEADDESVFTHRYRTHWEETTETFSISTGRAQLPDTDISWNVTAVRSAEWEGEYSIRFRC